METTVARRPLLWPATAVWAAGRVVLLLFVFKVVVFPGPDVTSDVSVIYHGWYDVLRGGTFPLEDVTWQYPPAAALAVLSPACCRSWGMPRRSSCWRSSPIWPRSRCCCTRGAGPAGRSRGAWLWVAGVPLLGPTVYARYDVMVTAVAVAALLAGARRPRVMGGRWWGSGRC
ncbi:hypothetical protein GCM10020256_57210 [Streptomyces thermocoprophilus]